MSPRREKTIIEYLCAYCRHVWTPRIAGSVPRMCPNCKRDYETGKAIPRRKP